MNFIRQTLRAILFVILAFFGLIMAAIFMISTLLAVGVLYIVARLQGRPFGVKAYWAERRRAPMSSGSAPWAARKPAGQKPDVVDIEMREIP
ncbi:hypothetical protein [Castellaniella sp.]|uniref:hypothetical protein n=1 Tax=Castellaniella sp. TaxID=1955812 RepID=UPI00355F9C89